MTSTIHLPPMGLRFGDGFRQFLASSPATEEAPEPVAQPTQFLKSIPTTSVDTVLDRHFNATHQSIARSLTTSLLLAARPTRRSPSLAEAVMALKHATLQR